MDMYKLKFTTLQGEMLRFLSIKSGASFTARAIARHLRVSPTAIAKSLKRLEQEEMIKVNKDKESKRFSIQLNKDNPLTYQFKRADNLKLIYESGLLEYLSETLPTATIILFGSYSFGEDTLNSDIDLAIIGAKQKEVNLDKFNRLLERNVSINFYPGLKDVNKNLKENIFNGIVLKGGIQL